MYFIPYVQYQKDLESAKEFIKSERGDYCTKILNFEVLNDIILVNAIEQVYRLRSFDKIISSHVATQEEIAYVFFLLLKACKKDTRLAYGRKMFFNTSAMWVELNINGNYIILDPVTKNVVEAPNNVYLPVFAFDGSNLIFINDNL